MATTLDGDRDLLQKEVDDKTEELLKLDERLIAHEKDDTELKLSLEELEENLRFRVFLFSLFLFLKEINFFSSRYKDKNISRGCFLLHAKKNFLDVFDKGYFKYITS